MSEQNQHKQQQKTYKKARRKSHGAWKALTFITAPIAILLAIALVGVSLFDNTLALVTGGRFWELENEDSSAQYYTPDFNSDEERLNAGYNVVYQVEAEGATLLMNNGVLPLAEGAKVSTFSTSSVSIIYGGSGSGNVDADAALNLRQALEKSGFAVNETLWDFYLAEENAQYLRENADDYCVSEMPWEVYTQDVLESVSDYGDAAIVTLSRTGGEGGDLEFREYNYLALDENEREMFAHLKEMKDVGTVKSIIVLINSSNPLQVDLLKENEYGIDAAMWIGGLGDAGIDAVADILAGKVNPSGSLVDTYCYDNFSSAAMLNNVATCYEGYDASLLPSNAGQYMIYQEGIYVGYKNYETRYEDYVMGTGNAGDYAYGDDVAFPFGYGLSYTQFQYSDVKLDYDADTTTYTMQVTVTNTGGMAGKETVQVYVSSPYTQYDIDNGVEKASVSLVGFGKTRILEPGASETLTITVDGDYVASFDTYGAGTYILDAGDYYFTAATDAHNAVNNVLAAKGYTPENTDGRMDATGDVSLVAVWNNPALDTTTYAVSDNGTAITNRLSDADILHTKNYQDVTVKDICEEARIPRRTFYHYFDSKDDVLDSIIESLMTRCNLEVMFDFQSGLDAMRESFARFFRFWSDENRWKLDALLKNGLETRLMTYSMKWTNTEKVGFPRPENASSKLIEVGTLVGSSSFFALLFHWSGNGYQESPEEMAEYAAWFLSEPLYKP